MQRRRRINPMDDAKFFAHTGRDKLGLDINYINAFKGRGIFTSAPFEKGDFLCEYRGDLITNEECERRQKIYHDALKVFMFEFRFSGKLWCVDAAKEDGSLGRLVNDDHISPNAKMKYLNVQGKPHLCLFAIRDIVAGEEITYNYGDSDWPWRSKKSGGMSSDVKHGEAPCTAKLSTRTQKRSTHEAPKMMPTRTSAGRPKCFNKGIDEDMPQGSPNTTNSQTLDEGHVQMTIERSQIEMTASNLNQTSPVLDPLTRTGQMMTERGQIEMSASNLNQTSPVLDPLTGIGQGINEDMPQGSPETTNSQTPDEGHVQMTTERGQIEMSASNLNQRSPVLDPLTRIGQMMTERGQIEMSASNLNQTSPVLDPLTGIGQGINEDMPQGSPETTNSQTPDEGHVQMTTERGQIEMSASNLNQRSPVLDPLTRIGQMTTERGQIEMSASNLNQRSPVLDPLTRIAQMTTERGQIEMSASNLNQRSPVLDPLTRIAQMTTERGQIEMSASNLNQRSPVLDPLTRIGQMTTERGQIEMSASNLNQRSPVLDPLTRIAQMTTERGQIEMSASNLNQRSPVLDPLTRIAQV
ncbi:uncharacterized protein LOC128441835 [Pleuronectes platessa]|uniref:uncharacterized protein LOC128441835 n=1 Tax=Pleuronectes platessa TaxID=8262 RepID=UPI00232A2BCD|nr:uncharacterized protein LOC128441835 [Pleuronectes platessa]